MADGVRAEYSHVMVRLLRLTLHVVIAFLLLAVVLGLAATQTGALEKVILAVVGVLLVLAAWWVRHLGDDADGHGSPPRGRSPHPS